MDWYQVLKRRSPSTTCFTLRWAGGFVWDDALLGGAIEGLRRIQGGGRIARECERIFKKSGRQAMVIDLTLRCMSGRYAIGGSILCYLKSRSKRAVSQWGCSVNESVRTEEGCFCMSIPLTKKQEG